MPPPLPRPHYTATPPLATTLLLWMPTDHPQMAAFSPWAVGLLVLLFLCPPAPDSALLCTHPATTIWKPPQHPSTGEGISFFFIAGSPEWRKVCVVCLEKSLNSSSTGMNDCFECFSTFLAITLKFSNVSYEKVSHLWEMQPPGLKPDPPSQFCLCSCDCVSYMSSADWADLFLHYGSFAPCITWFEYKDKE